ncbi:MAG: EamA family transporter [Bacteroidales bacterium]|nr:EamA family transporter [Bacteroidales bacterium]
MIWLLLNILISVAILTTFRLFDRFGVHRDNAIVSSYLASLSLSYLFREKSIVISDLPQYPWFYLGLFIGVSFYFGFQLFARSTAKAGMAITSVSSNTSVVIPVTIALIFYNEDISFVKLIGILIVVASFFLIFKKEKSENLDWRLIFLPIILFFVSGINASLMGFAEKKGVNAYLINFMMLIFAAAFLTGIAKVVLSKNKKRFTIKTIAASLVLGSLNFLSTMIIIKALDTIPDSVFFPVYNSGYIVLAALVGFIFFREKLLKINLIGIGLALVGIIILSSGI